MENNQDTTGQDVSERIAKLESQLEEKLSHIHKLNEENKERRLKLEEYEKLEEQKKQQELEQQGKYKELLEEKEAKLNELSGKVETLSKYEQEVQKIRQREVERIQEVLKTVPENFSHMFAKFSDDMSYDEAVQAFELYEGIKKSGVLDQDNRDVPSGRQKPMKPKGKSQWDNIHWN